MYYKHFMMVTRFTYQNKDKKQYPNQFLILKSTTNSKNSALCRFVADDKPLKKIYKQEKNMGADGKKQRAAVCDGFAF